MRESSTGGVGCFPATIRTLSVWAGLVVSGCGSSRALLADASRTPEQANTEADAAATIARVIFWKCILLLYGGDGR